MNGGAGLRLCLRVPTFVTRGSKIAQRGGVALGRLAIADIEGSAVDPDDLGREGLAGRGREDRLQRPVLAGREGGDLALALHDQAHRDGLHAPGRQPRADLPADQRAERVADEPVDDPPRLLGIDEVRVDLARMGEGLTDGALGDLVERDPLGLARGHMRRLGDVPGDRLAFPVEVGRQVDRVGDLGGLADLGDLLAAVVGDDVFGGEVMVDVDAELALAGVLGQVADVAVGGQDTVVRTQVALDRPSLGRRSRRSLGSLTRPGV